MGYPDDKRNPMTLEDVNEGTPFEIDHTFRATYRKPAVTVAYVCVIKPCGCTGPTLGSIETVIPPRGQQAWKMPDNWAPSTHGYTMVQEAKDRAALFLHGERLYGKRSFGVNLDGLLRRLSWSHYRHMLADSLRPRYPDSFMHKTAKEAMERRPRASCKLWGVFPDKPYRSGSRPKPVGYVWGKEAAAKALHEWWVLKNRIRRTDQELDGLSDYGNTDEMVDTRPPDEDISSAAIVMAIQRG